jgi:5-methylcytosine-specific restriction endonuclease McrA
MVECTCRHCGALFPYEPPPDRWWTRRRTCDDCRRRIHNDRCRRWTEENPEGRKQIRNGWVARNSEQMKATREDWRRRHPEAGRISRRKAKKKNPVANRASVRKRKARMRGNQVASFTPSQLASRLAYFGNRCWMCGGSADSIDHVKPISKGGAHMLCNLRPACMPCNSMKNDQWPYRLAEP